MNSGGKKLSQYFGEKILFMTGIMNPLLVRVGIEGPITKVEEEDCSFAIIPECIVLHKIEIHHCIHNTVFP